MIRDVKTKLTIYEAIDILRARPRLWKNVLSSSYWARHLSKKAGKLTLLDFAKGAKQAGVNARIEVR